MTERNMQAALEEAKRVVAMIEADELASSKTLLPTSTKTTTQDGWNTENQYQLTPHSLNGVTAVKTVPCS